MNKFIRVLWFILVLLASLSILWLIYLIWKEKPLDVVDRAFITLLLGLNIAHLWTFKK